MAKKKGKGFGDLTKKVLTDKPDNAPTSLADFQDSKDVKTPEPQDAKALKRHSVKTSKQQDAKTLDQRMTLYLSEEGFDALEDAWVRLRKMARGGDRKRISKSLIIEEALLIVLDELESKAEKSRLVKALKL